jgi:hypothetical protein
VAMRERPLWTQADSDFHGDKGASLTNATTLFYLKEFKENDVYQAMREGRMVALTGSMFQDCYVAEFSVTDGKPARDPIMFGKEIKVSVPPVIRFKLDHEIPGVKTQLIRNGKVVKEVAGSTLEFTDRELFESKLPGFYRVVVTGPDDPKEREGKVEYDRPNLLYTNPVFVKI